MKAVKHAIIINAAVNGEAYGGGGAAVVPVVAAADDDGDNGCTTDGTGISNTCA